MSDFEQYPNDNGNSEQNLDNGDYGQASYNNFEGEPQGGNGLSIASLVLGILAVVFCCCSPFNSVFSILAIVFGIIGIKKNAGREMAIAGLVLGIISILIIVVCLAFGMMDYLQAYL